MDTNKVIKNFAIEIGQTSIGSIPVAEPIIIFVINDRVTSILLMDFKKIIDDIYNSKGNRSIESYAAKIKLDEIFTDILLPFLDIKL